MTKKIVCRTFLLLLAAVLIFRFYDLPEVYAQTKDGNYKLIRTFERDTTGDKINDVVKVMADVKNGGYVVEIEQHNGKTFALKPSGEFKFLAPYTTFWDINIQIEDINNDKIPEIITWGQMSHENAVHIFRWNGSEYKMEYSGFDTGFYFEDITGDGVLDMVIDDRIYGTGDEFIYYQWQENRFKNIYYRIIANRGFEKIQDVMRIYQVLHANGLSYSKNYFERYFEGLFTKDLINNKNNIPYLKEFGKNLFSIQITKYINEKLEFDHQTGDVIKDTWTLKVHTFNINDTRIIPRDMVMTVVTKREEKDEFKIDFIKFSDSDYSRDSFYESVNYDPSQGLLRFTIPEIIPEGYKFYLHVSGRLYMGSKNNGMSFHAFDEESQNYSWKNGKTYTYFLKPEGIDQLLLAFGLVDKKGQGTFYQIEVLSDGTKSIKISN